MRTCCTGFHVAEHTVVCVKWAPFALPGETIDILSWQTAIRISSAASVFAHVTPCLVLVVLEGITGSVHIVSWTLVCTITHHAIVCFDFPVRIGACLALVISIQQHPRWAHEYTGLCRCRTCFGSFDRFAAVTAGCTRLGFIFPRGTVCTCDQRRSSVARCCVRGSVSGQAHARHCCRSTFR